MKKNIVKSLYSFGTAVLAFGTLATASMPIVSATTVSSSQEAAVSQVVASSKSKSSLQNSQMSSRVLTTVASSKAMSQPSASSSTVEGSQTSASNASVAHQSSVAQHSMKVMHLAANASSEEGPYVISGTMPTPATADDGWEVTQGPDHDGEVVYCYDPDNFNPEANGISGNPLVENPAGGVHYNRSDLWNGSEANGYSAASVDKVAAVMYAGYPNNIGGSQHNGPISQAQVDQWYQQYLAKASKNNPSASKCSEAQYEYDMTQDAIWGVEGNVPGDNVADSPWSKQYQKDPLSRALYDYAQQHPLDSQNAVKNGVTLENAQGQPIGANDTLTVDPSTHESEGFQVKGGDVTLPSSMNGYKVVNAQGQAISTLEPGETYHVVFEPSTDPTKINMLCPYLHVATADYYHSNEAEGTMTYGPDKGQKKPWQNMVGLETNMVSLNIKFAMSSSQSSTVSSSKKSLSSSVKSSSSSKKSSNSVKSSSSSKKSSSSAKSSSITSSKKSSSSVKSSSVASSKKSSSSVKSSSIASSKKSSSSAKSSSVASSEKTTATTSSETTKNSSSKATKTTSSVASAKKTSSSVSTKVATSSSNNTTSTKKGVVAGVANHSSNSGKGTGHGQGQGEGHGMPQTGEAVATSLIAAGVVLLAAAGAITLRKRN